MRFAGLIAVILAVPAFAHAAVLKTIVPACAYSSVVCQACDLVAMAHNILFDFVELGAMAATLMFAYAGYLYVTAAANHNNLEQAKKIFWSSLIGLIFIIGAWLIVDLALRVFMGQPLNVISDITCVTQTAVNGGFEFNPVNTQEGSVSGTSGPVGAACTNGMTHDNALGYLKAANIQVTSTAGAGGVSGTCSGKGCTNLSGICPTTVQGLVDIARESGCPITVFGAAEGGDAHNGTTHKAGRAFDVNNSACLGAWLNAHGKEWGVTQVCTTAADVQYRYNCSSFNEATNHFHITF